MPGYDGAWEYVVHVNRDDARRYHVILFEATLRNNSASDHFAKRVRKYCVNELHSTKGRSVRVGNCVRQQLVARQFFVIIPTLVKMSLFGQPNPGSSPFGTQGTSSASAFAPQPAQTGNLFGGPASSQPAQTGALLGSTFGSRLQQQPSPFPAQGGQANPPLSLGAFGALGTTQAQSIPTGGAAGGTFGLSQQPSAQPQQSSNPFPPHNNAAGNQPFGSCLLVPSQNQQQPPNQFVQAQDVNIQQPTGLVKTSQPAYFNSLLEKGKKRAHAADGGPGLGDMPSLQLGLEDIARRARELGGLGSQDKGAPPDGKALASRSFL
jgi:hypothetical protein